jgi:FkbM family methyltransferase
MTSEAELKKAVTSGRYALVGAGQLGAMSLGLWPDRVARPEFFLDSVRTGDMRGIEIRDLKSHVRVPGITYLASAFKMTPRELRDIFRRIGQPDILTVYDFFEEFAPTVFTNGWRNVAPTPETERRLARLPQFYADETSARICQAVTAWRYRRELVDDYPVWPEENKYNLALFGRAGTHYDVVYDCGSFDFSLVKCLSDAGITFDRLVAFEPDPASHELCRREIAKRSAGERQIILDRRAVSDRGGHGTFLASGLRSARLIEDLAVDHPGLIAVDTCTLDSVHEQMFGWRAAPPLRVLIKLHIEGAELAALKGAGKLIRQTDAEILLNISHDEISYLEIPEFLAGFGCYDLILRSHSLFGEGLTVFARHRNVSR